ncbi:proton-coupled amino acid transporter-like protein CG1139 isoform X2 [Anoplophora glabripennis]|uniref:proton-coupled amino acid transporter-like protein CG1139 isoform X2 n=1 Tax=Anoplophora glabripennis TaxID=217634 RepID=UPI0008738FA6|nr:proton-coupled amino acid transporter-like protein CG1139 isoform X2 [Anoplophora glabripennis]
MPSENLENVKLEPIGTTKKLDEHSVLLDEGTGDKGQDDEEYDPHLHRQVEKPTTNAETLIHLLKGCLGTGILAMPEAFKFSGMANGIISTILIGALCTYCLHVLVKAQYVLCKRLKVPLLTYPESMKVACELGPPCLKKFAPYAPDVTNFFLVFYQIGICCVYVVFVGKNLKAVVDIYTEPKELSLTVYIISVFLPFVLIICVRNLKLLAPFSVVANIITFITFGVVGYYVCQQLPAFSDLPAFGTLFNYPLYFGTTLFSLQAVGVVIALENNMKTPKTFRGAFGVLNVGMGIVTVIYVLMAMMGYWRYGEKIKDSITLNFPKEDILAQVIKIMYSIAIFISYGLQGYVPVQILWTNYIEKHLENKQLFWEYVLRVGCVLVTFVLAATVPLLGLFISLVGAFCLSALGIAFPAIIELCAYWPNNLGPGKWILIKDVILIIIGIVGLCAGSYSCIYSIVNELAKGNT